jgi:hypothetical protein
VLCSIHRCLFSRRCVLLLLDMRFFVCMPWILQAVADGLEVPERGRAVVEKHRQHLADVAASARGRGSLRVAAIQWPQPLMACGAWVPEMIKVSE